MAAWPRVVFRMVRDLSTLALLASMMILGSCGGSRGISACTPGAATACACTSGQTGAQTCLLDGTSYGTCTCTGGGTGGGGAGGSQDAGADIPADGTDGNPDGPASGDAGDGGGHGVALCTGPNGLCTDFPPSPIVEPGVSTSICSAPSGPGPCIVEPENGSLFPNNWLRPRVSVQGIAGPMKITVHSDQEVNDLVVYASSTTWTMPKDIWNRLAAHVQDAPISVTVCRTLGGQSTSTFTIAPVSAPGSMLFWSVDPALADIDEHACQTSLTATCAAAGQLLGFSVGDETTEPVLDIGQIQQPSRLDSGAPAPVTCVGCHSPMPDPEFVTFVDSYPWRAGTASVQGTTSSVPSGAPFPTLTSSGLAALQQPGWGPLTFNRNVSNDDFWRPGLRIGIGSLGLRNPLVPTFDNSPDQNDSPNLAWFNLEAPPRAPQNGDATSWAYASFASGTDVDSGNALGFIQHTGDMCGNVPCGAGMPSWSHDGSKIVYVSTNAALSGRFNQENPNAGPATGATQANFNPQRAPGMTNLFVVPFNRGLGGAASPITGAATTAAEEYYPALSPDDTLVAFTRVPAGEPMYANPHEEIYIVPTAGGSATRLAANSPPSCSGKSSPGVNNHWTQWSPGVSTVPRGVYYWMVFASTRADLPPGTSSHGRTIPISQLYLAPVVVDAASHAITTYPAIYLWNQPTTTVNTTPSWTSLQTPIPP